MLIQIPQYGVRHHAKEGLADKGRPPLEWSMLRKEVDMDSSDIFETKPMIPGVREADCSVFEKLGILCGDVCLNHHVDVKARSLIQDVLLRPSPRWYILLRVLDPFRECYDSMKRHRPVLSKRRLVLMCEPEANGV